MPPREILGRWTAEQTVEVVRNGEDGTKRQATPRMVDARRWKRWRGDGPQERSLLERLVRLWTERDASRAKDPGLRGRSEVDEGNPNQKHSRLAIGFDESGKSQRREARRLKLKRRTNAPLVELDIP